MEHKEETIVGLSEFFIKNCIERPIVGQHDIISGLQEYLIISEMVRDRNGTRSNQTNICYFRWVTYAINNFYKLSSLMN